MDSTENANRRTSFAPPPRQSFAPPPRQSIAVSVRPSIAMPGSVTKSQSGDVTAKDTRSRSQSIVDVANLRKKSTAIVEEIEDADQFFIARDDEFDDIGDTLKDLDTQEGALAKEGSKMDSQIQVEKKGKGEEELQEDFFDKVVDADADKKKVVKTIDGMTETVEEEVEPAKKDPDTHSMKSTKSVRSEKRGSKASVRRHRKSTESRASEKRESVSTGVSFGPDEISDQWRESIATQATGTTAATTSTQKRTKEKKSKEGKAEAKVEIKAQDMPVYETAPRYEGSDEALLGFDISQEAEPVQLFDYIEEVVEEEESLMAEEEIPVLEREPYYARHKEITEEIFRKQSFNFILQKKLAMFFKRRKMDYVTKETEWSFDSQQKYHRKLEAYGELTTYARTEREQMTQAMECSKAIKDKKSAELEVLFKKMQERECEIGYGLINTKTGNAIPDKAVERLIRRQHFQMDQVCSMRLKFIRLKDMVQEKLDAITALDKIGPNLLLADYEQLKIDNMSHADKIEEKEEELARLRSKCANNIQVLAHIREKSAALEADVDDLKQERLEIESEYVTIRENMNYCKTQRMTYRHMTNKIVEDSGLLTQPTLLKDMEQGLQALEEETAQLNSILFDYKKRARHIKNIRRKIEEQTEIKKLARRRAPARKASLFATSKTFQKTPKIYTGRPTLLMPTIDMRAFEGLKAIKPKMTFTRRRRSANKSNAG